MDNLKVGNCLLFRSPTPKQLALLGLGQAIYDSVFSQVSFVFFFFLQRQLDIVAESLQEERCNSEVCIQFFLCTLEFPHGYGIIAKRVFERAKSFHSYFFKFRMNDFLKKSFKIQVLVEDLSFLT